MGNCIKALPSIVWIVLASLEQNTACTLGKRAMLTTGDQVGQQGVITCVWLSDCPEDTLSIRIETQFGLDVETKAPLSKQYFENPVSLLATFTKSNQSILGGFTIIVQSLTCQHEGDITCYGALVDADIKRTQHTVWHIGELGIKITSRPEKLKNIPPTIDSISLTCVAYVALASQWTMDWFLITNTVKHITTDDRYQTVGPKPASCGQGMKLTLNVLLHPYRNTTNTAFRCSVQMIGDSNMKMSDTTETLSFEKCKIKASFVSHPFYVTGETVQYCVKWTNNCPKQPWTWALHSSNSNLLYVDPQNKHNVEVLETDTERSEGTIRVTQDMIPSDFDQMILRFVGKYTNQTIGGEGANIQQILSVRPCPLSLSSSSSGTFVGEPVKITFHWTDTCIHRDLKWMVISNMGHEFNSSTGVMAQNGAKVTMTTSSLLKRRTHVVTLSYVLEDLPCFPKLSVECKVAYIRIFRGEKPEFTENTTVNPFIRRSRPRMEYCSPSVGDLDKGVRENDRAVLFCKANMGSQTNTSIKWISILGKELQLLNEMDHKVKTSEEVIKNINSSCDERQVHSTLQINMTREHQGIRLGCYVADTEEMDPFVIEGLSCTNASDPDCVVSDQFLVVYPVRERSTSLIWDKTEVWEGMELTLVCCAESMPAASFTWLTSNPRRFNGMNSTTTGTCSKLVLKELHRKDDGYYSCMATNIVFGEKFSVRSDMQLEILHLRITTKPPNITDERIEEIDTATATQLAVGDASLAAAFGVLVTVLLICLALRPMRKSKPDKKGVKVSDSTLYDFDFSE